MFLPFIVILPDLNKLILKYFLVEFFKYSLLWMLKVFYNLNSFLQAVSETLSIGAPLLLPPLHERMELLHSLLPQGPDRWDSLSRGQVRGNTRDLK